MIFGNGNRRSETAVVVEGLRPLVQQRIQKDMFDNSSGECLLTVGEMTQRSIFYRSVRLISIRYFLFSSKKRNGLGIRFLSSTGHRQGLSHVQLECTISQKIECILWKTL
jgi:hypothetical protein